jgi:hypothetical protein
VDRIYALACPASPVHYQYNPSKTIWCETAGALVIAASRQAGEALLAEDPCDRGGLRGRPARSSTALRS